MYISRSKTLWLGYISDIVRLVIKCISNKVRKPPSLYLYNRDLPALSLSSSRSVKMLQFVLLEYLSVTVISDHTGERQTKFRNKIMNSENLQCNEELS